MRVIYGWILFFVAIAVIMGGGLLLAILLGIAAYMAGREYLAIARARGIRPSARIVLGMTIAFFVMAGLPAIPGLNLSWNFSIEHFPILLTIGICSAFFRLLFRNEKPPATIADIATTILGFIYIGWMPSHLVLLRNLCPPGMEKISNPLQQPGLAYVWVTLFIIWASDVFAYYAGKKWGRHLLFPQVSPKKTVEGAIGGLVAAVFFAVLVVYLSDNFLFPSRPFGGKLWQAPLMGVVVSLAGQFGDLCESLLKRDAGVKDSGSIIPGHGGLLDRGDSMIFGVAVSYYWICLVVLGLL
jgi:phosphatidate cytidylyltransferase